MDEEEIMKGFSIEEQNPKLEQIKQVAMKTNIYVMNGFYESIPIYR